MQDRQLPVNMFSLSLHGSCDVVLCYATIHCAPATLTMSLNARGKKCVIHAKDTDTKACKAYPAWVVLHIIDVLLLSCSIRTRFCWYSYVLVQQRICCVDCVMFARVWGFWM